MKLLVTGSAGFIGYHMVKRLMKEGNIRVVGIDNLNNYYDPLLKTGRLRECGIQDKKLESGRIVQSEFYPMYQFIKMDITSSTDILKLFKEHKFDAIIHLAAQAGVRYSLEAPFEYINSNIAGFMNLLEAVRMYPVNHLIYASTSSVYGLNADYPFTVSSHADHPVSLYAATKKANEMMAHSYSHLFNIPVTGLRFFTVYGPWGRPDMALFKFVSAIKENKPIEVYNHGNMKRDFTYVEDIVENIFRLISFPPCKNKNWNASSPDPSYSSAAYRLLNIGNSSPVSLMEFIDSLEEALGKKAIKNLMPMQPGDVIATWADVEPLVKLTGFRPQTTVREGVMKFVKWHSDFYS